MCCWPYVDVVLEDPPPKPEEEKEFHLVSDKLNLVGHIIEMSFYYNYTGPYPGTLNQNRANQAPAAQEPINPWLVPAPQPAPQPAPAPASNSFYYYPRYDPQPAPAAQPAQPAQPINPWLAPKPEPPKASRPDAFPAQPAYTYQPQAPLYYAGHPIPEPAKIWYGSTKAEVDAQNAALAQGVGAYKPMNMVPANPGAGQQFWCKELNGCYTLRTMTDIESMMCPEHKRSTSGGTFKSMASICVVPSSETELTAEALDQKDMANWSIFYEEVE
ncbi:MAG: hypothetical protein Q9168_002369 [Polycauliona sp. 1 TL-2023]